MRVIVTGGAGYLGSSLLPLLQQAGHEILVLDSFCYDYRPPEGVAFRRAYLSEVQPEWLYGFDAVVHLAACANDSLSEAYPSSAWRTNLHGSETLISACIAARIPRFVQASTCSIYGYQPDRVLDESASLPPNGLYSKAKHKVEDLLQQHRSATFHPFILRFAPLYGWSPRMRTDIVVNSMTRCAMLYRQIVVHSPETWRPLLHVQDAADSLIRALEAPASLDGIYNVHAESYQLLDLACYVRDVFFEMGDVVKIAIEPKASPISYRIKSEKIRTSLNFAPRWQLFQGIQAMLQRSTATFDWWSIAGINVHSCRNTCNAGRTEMRGRTDA